MRAPRIFFSMALMLPCSALATAGSLWTPVEADTTTGSARATSRLGDRQLYRLAMDRLEAIVALAGPEEAALDQGVVVELPLPDGSLGSFLVHRSRVMARELADRYPAIRTFRGVGLDDASAVVHFELTPIGFHGMILSAGETVFVNPVDDDRELYRSFERGAEARRDFECAVGKTLPLPRTAEASPEPASLSTGAHLRTYRTAIAATGEYTRFHGGTRARALAAIVVALDRLNGIFHRELSLKMELVADNDQIIFTDPATDPFTPDDRVQLWGQTQATIDDVIGSANYDHGHVFTDVNGGAAGDFGTTCKANIKAYGISGLRVPAGEVFVVDLVAHEMGHQFGAAHTYNSAASTCQPYRHAWAAYEPGSGSTIMSYAGICAPENLQAHSDDVFHAVSLDEMQAYFAAEGGSCGSLRSTGNRPPVVEAGPVFTIPAQTAFELRGSGSDATALTYSWEQFDLGPPSPPLIDDGQRPIIRSYAPSASPLRVIPRLEDILASTSTLGETLPTTNRDLTFRLVARDGRGGVADDSVVLRVRRGPSPFRVVAPRGGDRWQSGGLAGVSWNVAGTSAPPFSCHAVDITLSWDGGLTFPHSLAEATSNDGFEEVIVPFQRSSRARVKVACSDNLFFGISPRDHILEMPSECLADEFTLCLEDDRFLAQVRFSDFEGVPGRALAHELSSDAGYFTFFRDDNAEIFLKVIDACSLSGNHWVFDTHLSNVEYTLVIADTQTGQTRTIVNALGEIAPAILGTDTIFTECGDGDGSGLPRSELIDTRSLPAQLDPSIEEYVDANVVGSCTSDASHVCLSEGRFRVHASFENFQGASGIATMWPLSGDSAYATFFNDANVELFLKVIDACNLPQGRFWVFASGLTNVLVDLLVEDTLIGKVWHQHNASAATFSTALDTATFFVDCP